MEEQEECYVLTPKGCACLALSQAGICDINDSRIEPFWVLFEHYMKEAGYIREDNKT